MWNDVVILSCLEHVGLWEHGPEAVSVKNLPKVKVS